MDGSKELNLALQYAKEKHKGQKRIGGDDYITHPVAVCEIVKSQGFDQRYQIAALFHDLLEDTDATEEEILKYGGADVLEAVKLLTKEHGYDIAEYISNIMQNPIAFAVKAADRLHNLQCAIYTDEKFKRKYIDETLKWYMDFSVEIQSAVQNLEKSLDAPLDGANIKKEITKMTIEKKINNDAVTLIISGRLDTQTAPDLEAEVDGVITGIKDLTFDMTNLEHVSSAGLRVILKAQKIMNKQGSMKLAGVNDCIMEVFDITGFLDILTIE